MTVKKIDIIYNPHVKQQKFHDSSKKYRAFITGLGGGKTYAGSKEAISTMLEYPNSFGAILAPTYPLLRDSTIKTFFELLPYELILEWNKTEHYLKLKNGAETIFRPCNDQNAIDRLRNINLGWAWIDEAALVSEYAFKVIIGRLRQEKTPRNLWLTTTPKGFNWIWEKFINNAADDFEAILGTTLDNPHLPLDYKQGLIKEYTGVFARQEIYGEFVGFEGQVYSDFNRNTHVIQDIPKYFPEIVYGHDWGYTNPAVILVIGVDNDYRYYIIDEIYEKHLDIDEIVTISKQLETKYGIGRHFADPSEPQYIEKLNNEHMRTEGVKTEILAGIGTVNSLLRVQGDGRPRLFINENCVNTIMEFENYRYPEKKTDKPIQENPLKIHDHAMDALRYTVMGHENKPHGGFKLG